MCSRLNPILWNTVTGETLFINMCTFFALCNVTKALKVNRDRNL